MGVTASLVSHYVQPGGEVFSGFRRPANNWRAQPPHSNKATIRAPKHSTHCYRSVFSLSIIWILVTAHQKWLGSDLVNEVFTIFLTLTFSLFVVESTQLHS